MFVRRVRYLYLPAGRQERLVYLVSPQDLSLGCLLEVATPTAKVGVGNCLPPGEPKAVEN